MKPPDPTRNGDPVSKAAARVVDAPAKEPDAVGAGVNADDLEPIGIDESRDFIRLEQVIERGLGTFLEVGAALAEIRDRRLYRIEHKTFDAYCRDKWKMGRTYAHRLMAAAETTEMLPTGNKPTSERQVRALAKLPAEKRPEAWQRAIERADGGQPTALEVEAVVEEVATPPAGRPVIKIDAAERIWAVAKGHLDKIIDEDVSVIRVMDAVAAYCEGRKAALTARKVIDFSDGLATTQIGKACGMKDRTARRNTLLRLAAFAVLNATEKFDAGMILRNVDELAKELGKLADKLDRIARGSAP